MHILVTGGCGFIGSNLVAKGLSDGYQITVLDNMSRSGTQSNKQWIETLGNVEIIQGDVSNPDTVSDVIKSRKIDAIFHLAGQVAMTKSIENPRKDFEINTLGTLNILESVRKYCPSVPILYSSTNKVYGDLEQYHYKETNTRYICEEHPLGFDESTPLDFHSPYGCSKGSADQYLLDYSRIYGLNTVVFRHSSMYGGRQFSTFDQGWVGWFCRKALETTNDPNTTYTISGNGKQVRDVVHCDDIVSLYYSTLNCIDKAKGNAFNIGGTEKQSLSLIELFHTLEELLDIKLNYSKLAPRESDQKVFIADITKAEKIIKWKPIVDYKTGIIKMLDWMRESKQY